MADTATARVPAWKRLGLKLKFANETPAEPLKTPSTTATSTLTTQPQPQPQLQSQQPARVAPVKPPKRDREESFAPDVPAKRVKSQIYERPVPVPTRPIVAPEPYVPKRYGFAGISAEPTGKRTVFDDDDTAPITAAPISTEEPEEQATKKSRPSLLRKSVSFTPDTKQKDGETGQQYFKAWASGQDPTAIDPSTQEPTSPSKAPSTEQPERATKEPKQKKAKKSKKSKSTSIDSTPSKLSATTGNSGQTTAGEIPAYVAYLQQHHSDKVNWKFNKKKQNDLLKNVFNVQRLPAEFQPAIISYVAGLQGIARDRLATQAEEVLKAIYKKETGDESDAMSHSSCEARKAAYYGALQRHIEQCEARGGERDEHSDEQLRIMREEAQAGRLAQALLERSLMMELHPERVPVAATPSTATPPAERTIAGRVEKKRSKRKTRTTAEPDESSSDDSDDSDDDRPVPFSKDLLDQAFAKPQLKSATSKPLALRQDDSDDVSSSDVSSSSDDDDDSSESGA